MAIRKRTQKTSPNTAGNSRREQQDIRAANNRFTIEHGGMTPWMVSKHKRAAARRKRKFVALIDA